MKKWCFPMAALVIMLSLAACGNRRVQSDTSASRPADELLHLGNSGGRNPAENSSEDTRNGNVLVAASPGRTALSWQRTWMW